MDAKLFARIEKAVDISIAHVITRGVDDVFRPPVFSDSLENRIIKENADDFSKKARTAALKFLRVADLSVQPIGQVVRSLIAKDDKSFRNVCWIDPFDAVKYLSLCYYFFPLIESSRIPKQDLIIHSHRMSETEDAIFDMNYGYHSFRQRSGQLSRDNVGKWKVVTDISNFFDRVGNHSIKNKLLDLGCEAKLVSLLCDILFFWAGDRRSFGIPVGCDGSRIISEAVLLDTDRKLRESNISFLRYVDDFRLFANSRSEAYAHLMALTSILENEGLALNSKKTEIFQIVDTSESELVLNKFTSEEHETIDESKKIIVSRLIRVSGRSQISRIYQQPGKDTIDRIKSTDKKQLLEKSRAINEKTAEDHIKHLVKYFIHGDQDVSILEHTLNLRITSIFYICDAIIKEASKFDEITKLLIKDTIESSMPWASTPYPYKLPLLRLYSDIDYVDEQKLVDTLAGHRIHDNHLFLRETVIFGRNIFDAGRVRTLATEIFPHTSVFVRRAIFYVVANHPKIAPDQKRPLLKTMRQYGNDWFIEKMSE